MTSSKKIKEKIFRHLWRTDVTDIQANDILWLFCEFGLLPRPVFRNPKLLPLRGRVSPVFPFRDPFAAAICQTFPAPRRVSPLRAFHDPREFVLGGHEKPWLPGCAPEVPANAVKQAGKGSLFSRKGENRPGVMSSRSSVSQSAATHPDDRILRAANLIVISS